MSESDKSVVEKPKHGRADTADHAETQRAAELSASHSGINDRDALTVIRDSRNLPQTAQLAPLQLQDGTTPLTAEQKAQDSAIAIRTASGADSYFSSNDRDGIDKILSSKSQSERQELKFAYQKQYGHSLESDLQKWYQGASLDRSLNLLDREDTNSVNSNARNIHENLLENKTAGGLDRSSGQIEKDLRNILATANAEQIEKMDKEYQRLYHTTLGEAVKNDSSLSVATKDAAALYLNAGNKTHDQQTAQLVDIALKNNSLDQFGEAMRDASPEAKKAFLQNNGSDRIEKSFGHWYSKSDSSHAMDFVREGKLSVQTQIADNTHLFTNAAGVELAIKQMTAEQRKLFEDGKDAGLHLSPTKNNDASTQTARDYYKDMHEKLAKAGGSTTALKWEQMIAGRDENSLVSSLARHAGVFHNDGAKDTTADIRNMSAEDFKYAQSHPGYRKDLEVMMKALNQSPAEIKDSLSVYDRMVKADTYEHAKEAGKDSILNVLNGEIHWFGANRDEVLDSITHMSAADCQRYRTDDKFSAQLDEKIKGSIEDIDGQDSAKRMLDCVKQGKSPESDPVANILRIQNIEGAKTQLALKTVEHEFERDPSLKERVINPKTVADKTMSEQFRAAVKSAFADDYEVFGKPLLNQGSMPVDLRMHLGAGILTNDYKQIFNDLAGATPEEKARLKNDPAFKNDVLSSLDSDHRKIADVVMAQGHLNVEDKLRLGKLGWGGASEIVSDLQSIDKDHLNQVKDDYERKYGSSLVADMTAKLTGHERDQAEVVFAQGKSAQERIEIANHQTERSRSGAGAWVADTIYNSATGEQADNALSETNRVLAESNRTKEAIAAGQAHIDNVSPGQKAEIEATLQAKVQASLDIQQQATTNHAASKNQGAEYAGDAAITAAAIGSVIATGGVDAPLVATLAIAGAGIKVSSKAVLEGNDYDASAGQIAKDLTVGAVTGATSLIGPGEVAAVFGVGKTAAKEAAGTVVGQFGQQMFKEGGETVLDIGTQDVVRNALSSGAKKIDQKDFLKLAEKVLPSELTGAERAKAAQEIAASLEKNVSERMASAIVQKATHHVLNVAGGTVGGAAGGVTQGASEWEANKGVGENLTHVAKAGSMGALSGAIGGGVASAIGEGLGHLPKRSTEHSEPLSSNEVGRTERTVKGQTESSTEVPAPRPTELPKSAEAVLPTDRPGTEQAKITDSVQAVPKPVEISLTDKVNAMSEAISARSSDVPMTKEQFSGLFKGMNDGDKKLAIEVLEQSSPSMTSRNLDEQIRGLWDKIKTTGSPPVQKAGLTVYTLNGSDDGNMMAQLLRVKGSDQVKLNVVELDAAAIEKLKHDGTAPNGLFLDNLAHATPDQKDVLRSVANLQVSDLNGFNNGPNLIDFGAAKYAGPEGMRSRLKATMEKAQQMQEREPGLTDQEAVRKVMQGDTAAQVESLGANAHLVNPDLNLSGRQMRQSVDAADSTYQTNSLYNQFTQPLVTTDQVQQFLATIPAARREAAAAVLQDGAKLFNYPTMMEELRTLQQNIIDKMPPGTSAKDAIYVTNLEKPNAGSHLVMNTLFARVNDVDPKQFMTIEQLRALGPGGANGRSVVFLDDFSVSGRQAASLINQNADVLRDSGGHIVVGSIGEHEVSTNPWKLYETDKRYANLRGLDVTPVSNHTYASLFDATFQSQTGLSQYSDQLIGKWVTPMHDSGITSSIITPYGGPNNNPDFMTKFVSATGLRGRSAYKIPYMPPSPLPPLVPPTPDM